MNLGLILRGEDGGSLWESNPFQGSVTHSPDTRCRACTGNSTRKVAIG